MVGTLQLLGPCDRRDPEIASMTIVLAHHSQRRVLKKLTGRKLAQKCLPVVFSPNSRIY